MQLLYKKKHEQNYVVLLIIFEPPIPESDNLRQP